MPRPSIRPADRAIGWTGDARPSDRLDAAVAQEDAVGAHAGARHALGGIYAFTAYLLWGFLPLYFLLLAPTGPWELVAWRIVLSLGFCAILLTVTRSGAGSSHHAAAAAARPDGAGGRPDLRQLAGLHLRRR